MANIDNFFVYRRGPLPRLARDLRLLRYLAGIMLIWIHAGGRVRRAHRRAAETGDRLHIDFLAGRGKYD